MPMPRFKVEVEEIKKAELEGLAGLLAKLLGRFFDDMVTQIAEGRAALLNQKLNAEVLKRAAVFKEYGLFCGIDYTADQVVLHFDLTRLKSEGIVGYVFPTPQPGTFPSTAGSTGGLGSHEYTTQSATARAGPTWSAEGVACHVLDHAAPGTVPIYGWHGRRDHLYTAAADGERARRAWASGRVVWPFTSYAETGPRHGPSLPVLRTRGPGFTSTRLTRTPSSPSDRFNAEASSPARWHP